MALVSTPDVPSTIHRRRRLDSMKAPPRGEQNHDRILRLFGRSTAQRTGEPETRLACWSSRANHPVRRDSLLPGRYRQRGSGR
jgi:hypothetical protein